VVWFDSTKTERVIEVDITTLARDTMTRFVMVKSKVQPIEGYVFLKVETNPDQFQISNGNPVVAKMMVNPPAPCTQNCATNPPPPTGSGPVLFSGSLDLVKNALTNNGGNLMVMIDAAGNAVAAKANLASLMKDGNLVVVHDATDDTKVYVILGDANDPMKPMLRNGAIAVAPKSLLAGP
jgi:hypothetical protein